MEKWLKDAATILVSFISIKVYHIRRLKGDPKPRTFMRIITVGVLEKITNYNVNKNSCVEQFCDKKATHFMNARVEGVPMHLRFCDNHANILEVKKITKKAPPDTPQDDIWP